MHRLLIRQLGRFFEDAENLDGFDENLRDFITAVDDAYKQADHDRVFLERSMDLSSQELLERGEKLARQLAKQKHDEKVLRESKESYEKMAKAVDQASEMIVIFDPEDRIVFANRAWRQLNTMVEWTTKPGIKFEQHLRALADGGFVPEASGQKEEWIAERLEHHRNPPGPFEVLRQDNTWIMINEQVLEDGSIILIITDITEFKKLELMKTEFVSTVSHELRTPLTSIKGALGLIRSGVTGDFPEKMRSMLDIAYDNSNRLVALINDILDIEKIEANKMDFQMKPTEVVSLVEDAIEANKGYGDEYGVTFIRSGSIEEALVDGDKDRLMQVLSNLMSNAAKFSSDGERVELSVTRHGEDIRIAVKDNGPGIPEDFRDVIFEKFTQSDSSDTRQKGGTGLGLSIAQAIVERHRGTLGFDTEGGKGTTFYFDLPELAERRKILSSETCRKDQYRILTCEDEADIATLLKLMLENAGYQCTVARTAAQAKQLLEEADYDAMTLDLALPDQDGISLLEELRQKPKTQDLPVIVVSVSAREGQLKLNGDAFGVIDWIQKPIEESVLINRLAYALRQASGDRPRILHLEDDESVLQIVSSLVADTSEVVAAKTLREAKILLKRETFDLVLLDLMLPDADGEDLLPLLNKPGRPSTPVVIFSAKDVSHETAKGIQAVLVKSQTSNEELLSVINSAIEARRERQLNG